MAKSKRKSLSRAQNINKQEKKEQISRGLWLPLISILILPILINPWGFNRFALPKITFIQIILVMFAFKTLFNLSKERKIDFTIGKWMIPYAVFLAVALFSSIFSIHPLTAFFGQTNRYDGFTSLMSYSLFGFFISSMVKNKSDVISLHWVLLLGLIGVSAYAVLQHFGIGTGQWYAPSDIGRVFSTIGNSNLLGTYIALLLPALLTFFIVPRLKENDFIWVSWIAFPLAIAALVFSASRGPWLGAAVSLILFVLLIFGLRSKKSETPRVGKELRTVIFILVAVIVVASTIIFIAKPPETKVVTSYLDRVKSIFNVGGSSAQYRIRIWRLALKMVSDKPLLGSGPDTFKENFFHYRFPEFDTDLPADKAHNDMLQISTTVGLLGLSAFVWAFIYFFAKGFKLYRSLPDDMGIITAAYLSGMTGYLVSIQFNFSLPTVAPMFWAVFGIVISIAAQNKLTGVGVFSFSISKNYRKFVYLGIFAVLIISLISVRGIIADRYIDASMIYQSQQDIQSAIKSLDGAIKINSTEDSYYNMKAKILQGMASQSDKGKKIIEEAIKTYKKSKQINPNDEEVYFGLNAAYYVANSKFKMDIRDEAIENIEDLLEIAPESSKANQFLEVWKRGTK